VIDVADVRAEDCGDRLAVVVDVVLVVRARAGFDEVSTGASFSPTSVSETVCVAVAV
jgi:hypothetical protein